LLLRTLGIVVAALNEDKQLGNTVTNLLPVALSNLDAFEIIIINDGSTDQTKEVAEQLIKNNPTITIKLVNHLSPQGLGSAVLEGLSITNFDHLILVPGDNAYDPKSLVSIFHVLDSADLIISYRINQLQSRLFHRTIISHLFTIFSGLASGYWLKDYHGMPAYPVQKLRTLNVKPSRSSFQVEFLVALLRSGVSYLEVPVSLNPDREGSSRSLRVKAFMEIAKLMISLIISRFPNIHSDMDNIEQ
jgi:dolichol-phosphate mannosyltransferase